jgi:hypothetical protein
LLQSCCSPVVICTVQSNNLPRSFVWSRWWWWPPATCSNFN